MKRALCMAVALALMTSVSAFAQCGISQAQGLSPVVGSGNIQGCSVGQRINVATNSQSLASSLPPLQLNLPNPQAAPAQAASKPAVQQPARSDQAEEAEIAPQESRRRNPNLMDERSLMAFSTPARGREGVPSPFEHLVRSVSPQQTALAKVFSR